MIALHCKKGDFSEYWIEYFKENSIAYKIVNFYDNDVVSQVENCQVIMWHFHHNNYRDALFAKELLYSLQQAGKRVFPDFNTAWHFDDKIGQKYLLESISAPIVPSFVFYDKEDALLWAKNTSFPKVFKLRGGAGSSNVKLISTLGEANSIIEKCFGDGFSQYDKWEGLKDRINKFKSGTTPFRSVLGGVARFFKSNEFERMAKREKGYFYAQEFIPRNDYDIRVIVIGGKAFGVKRFVRKNDFRASGSGIIEFGRENFSEETLKLAFEVSKKLGTQCCAFDFIYDSNKMPLIVEISYGFNSAAYFKCEGYWNENLEFFEGSFNPYAWIVEDLLNEKR